MEPKFQTSFIPKRPTAGLGSGGSSMPFIQKKQPKQASSIFMMLGVTLFVLSIISVGLAYGWKEYSYNQQDELKRDLANREKQFNIELIDQLKKVNVQIDKARELLRSHAAVSTIFSVLSQLTAEKVRFSSLDVTGPKAQGDGITISLKGSGTDLMTVAFQSDVLSSLQNYGLRKVIKNPVIADPEINANGTVSFRFDAVVDPGSILYEKSIIGTSSSEPPPQQ